MFTARMQYALLLIKEVRETQLGSPVRLKEVCAKYHLKQEFLIQTARKLRLAGYLESVKGPGGGYVAARDLSGLSFLKLHKDMQPDTHALKVTACDEKAKYYILREFECFNSFLLDYKV